MPLLDLAAATEGDRVLVRLTGEADLSTGEQLADGLRAAAALGSGTVVLDLERLRFCDCSALRALAALVAELRSSGRDCRLVSASGAVRRLIELAGFEDLLASPLSGGSPPTGSAPPSAPRSADSRCRVRAHGVP